jgi:uncharacterized glyoxalase superfamily protein PhnB
VILPVSDIEQGSIFYGQLLDASGQRISPGRHYFDCGGTILACYDPVADGDSLGSGWHPHANQYLYFAVADLDATFNRAKAAGCRELDEKIETMPWGERLFYAKDPFGNPICFVDEKTLFTGL